MLNRWDVYHIPCKYDFGFIGQTKRTLKPRTPTYGESTRDFEEDEYGM